MQAASDHQVQDQPKTVFYADDRVFWVVQAGAIRFTIEGQEPFIATKGFLVQVPYRVPFQLETVGSAPSLYFAAAAGLRTVMNIFSND